jgi:cytoskeleton protein RodZ
MATHQNRESKTDLLFVEDIEVDQGVLPVDPQEPATINPSVADATGELNQSSGDIIALCPVSLGDRLRKARKNRGLSVADIAQTLNFQTSIVRSIEAGDLEALPTSYEVGFFRTYAQLVGEVGLGVTIDEAVEAIRVDFQPATPHASTTMNDHVEEASRLGTWIKIAIGAILVVGVVAWLSWPEGKASQTSTLGVDDIPIQYTFNLQADN